jgi:hypothetical protein
MLRRRYPPTSNASTRSALHDSSSSEDEEDQLLREEREQERILSEQHGEANEDPLSNSTSNKRQSDADIANALNSTSAVKKKKLRITLTGAHLTGPEGLIRIRHDFSKIKYRNPKPVTAKDRHVAKRKQFEREIHASAIYTARMMQAYQEFALDIAPNMHFNDTFIKIRDMGSKKDVKDYLDEMRQEVCKAHLEKIYGKDKAEKFVDEFENGMQSRGVEVEDEYANDQDYGAGIAQRLATLEASQDKEDDNNVSVSGNNAKLPLVRKNNDDDDDDEDENEASFDDVAPSQAAAENKDQEDTISAVAHEDLEAPTHNANQNNNGEIEVEDAHGDVDELVEDDDELEEPREDDDMLEEPHDVDDELKEPNEDDLEKPRAADISLVRPLAGVASEEPEESDNSELPAANDDNDDSSPITQDLDSNKTEKPMANDNSLEEPHAGGVSKELEESNNLELPAANDEKEDSSPITQDLESNKTEIVEFPYSQASAFGEGYSQESALMTQDTMVFDASQTQEATQDTLIVDASQTQMTADTLVLDSSQDLNENQEGKEESSSQDY